MHQLKFSEFKYWPQIAVLALILAGIVAYRFFAYYDTHSNDSYVSAPVINMTTLVSGTVTQVYVKDNQKVKKGEKLIEVDPLQFQYAVSLAKAKLKNAQVTMNEEQIAAAQIEVTQANHQLQQSTLTAPDDGYITNFHLQVGQYVQAGQGLFAFINPNHWWVITLYRETAIRLIQPGDKAKITIDMYPGKVFHGHVESIGWGINRVQQGNAAPSTLMYMEATEDWIRIAQRFPVRISIDDLTDEYPMRVGASATTSTYR
ncbi:MAG: HlyD family secretion protein [Legionella sp.]|nr:HlyD family secretion protein [Legionella sp.]